MPSFQNDHVPVPVGTAILMTQAQIDDIKSFLTDLHNSEKDRPAAVLSDAQFQELKKLLQPGYELSSAMLDDYNRQRSQPLAVSPAAPPAQPPAASLGWDGVGPMVAGQTGEEWRTQDEIHAGVSYYADRETIIAARPKP